MSEMPPQDPTPPPPPPPHQAPGSGASSINSLLEPPPAPGELAPAEHRMMGMLCHLLALTALLAIPFAHILGPLILWLVKKNDIPFVDDQGKESLNFQITVTIAFLAVGIVTFIISLIPILGWIIGCFLSVALIAAAIGVVVLVILAAIKANEGKYYRYPFSLRLIK